MNDKGHNGVTDNLNIKAIELTTMHRRTAVIEWIGVTHFTAVQHQPPVVFSADALGDGYPSQRLVLSPQHRVPIRSKIVLRMFGVEQVFASAKNLVGLDGVKTDDTACPIRYWHILCRTHCVILANDMPVETLFPGPMALAIMPQRALAEIARIKRQSREVFTHPC